MFEQTVNRQLEAVKALLAVDDRQQQTRYKRNNDENRVEDNHTVKNQFGGYYFRQNGSNRRECFPKLQSSKEQLKRNLRRLESFQVLRRGDIHGNALQPIKINQNIQVQEASAKTVRVVKQKECKSRIKKTKNEKSALEISKEYQIRNLMKQKNYSANALNLKTMHILQQIQQRNNRCSSILNKNHGGDQKKMNIVAFLKRAA